MQFKKALTAGILSVAVVVTSPTIVSASMVQDFDPSVPVENIASPIANPIASPVEENPSELVKQSQFHYATGVIKEINEGYQGSSILLIENEQGQIAKLVISKDTYILDNTIIAEGAEVTGYYDAFAPMIMIYPPQYSTKVLAPANLNISIKVDKFDENLVSYDGKLKLNISDDTAIIQQDGTAFKGELANRNLVVEYDIVAESYPMQTIPSKVVVLNDPPSEVQEVHHVGVSLEKESFFISLLRTISEVFKINLK